MAKKDDAGKGGAQGKSVKGSGKGSGKEDTDAKDRKAPKPAPATTTPVTELARAPEQDEPPPARPSTEVAAPTRPGAAPSGRASVPTGDDVTQALLAPLQMARRVLPERRPPVYLSAAALALVGILEWPAALGLGLAWEALRRWGPAAGSGTTGTGPEGERRRGR